MRKLTPNGVEDRYTMAFLKGLSYTENCYSCKYAGIKRCSDLTIGDSWGTDLSAEEQKKGISLALIQTEKGEDLIKRADLCLYEVDIEKAIQSNGQLRNPYRKIPERELFINGIKKGKDIYSLIGDCFRKMCIRQDIKKRLIRLHILHETSGGGYSIRYL